MTKAKSIRALLALLAFGSAGTASADTLQGTTKGFTSRPLTPSAGRPLLQSFHFRFTQNDHHFGGMEVAPDNFQAQKLNFGFSDKNGDDPYSYNLTVNRYFGSIRGYETEREFCHGKTCRFDIKRPTDLTDPVFVIVGFYLQYRGGDHHVRRIGISEDNGFVTVNLNDVNPDDNYSLDLKYAWIPRSSTSAVSSVSGSASGSTRRTIPVGKTALRGFEFEYVAPVDHHIRDLGVVMDGSGGLQAIFADNKGTEKFRYRVDYAVLR